LQTLPLKKKLCFKRNMDAHGLKIQGRGYLMFLPKSQGGSRLSGKIAKGVPLFRVLFLLHFYKQVFWNLPGGPIFTLPFPLTPLVCITETIFRLIMYNWSNVSFNYFVLNFPPANDCCSFKTKEQRSCFTFGEIIFPNKSIISLFNATTPNHFLLLLWQALVGHFQLFWFCF
jgi:hypothetical protein